MTVLGPDNAFWIDGEWLDFESIIDPDEVSYSRLRELEREDRFRQEFPNGDPKLVPYFKDLLKLAQSYFEETGRHLNVYGDIGELFGAIVHGLKLHRPHAQGSDGRMGNDFVEVKTISPLSLSNQIRVRVDRHFSKLLVVRIDTDFEVHGKMLARKNVVGTASKTVYRNWDNL